MRIDLFKTIQHALSLSFIALGLFDHLHDASQGRIVASRVTLISRAPMTIHRTGIHRVTLLLLTGIDSPVMVDWLMSDSPVSDFSINRQAFSWPYQHNISQHQASQPVN
jgi:hypothetical protein